MSAADFTILERDELGNIKEMSVNNDDGEDNNDIDEDDDDAEYGAEARRSEQDNRLENITSMSESYSEILDSPVNSPTHEISEAIKGSPMRIPSRRPMNLQQTSGKCMYVWDSRHTRINIDFCFELLQPHSRMVRSASMTTQI